MFEKLNDKDWGALVVILFLILIGVLIKNAWICDDAYITFRTIDNFVNNYGLRWNIVERVQTYTHPLWMMIITVPYYFIRNIYYITIVISILLTLATVYLVYTKLSLCRLSFISVILLMILSKSFIDYSTSGLEVPLTLFLLAILVIVYLDSTGPEMKLLRTSFLTALIFLSRQDLILLALPILIAVLLEAKTLKNSKKYFALLLGFTPAILWELFSLIYYGFLFPNTAYAKLNTGIDWFLSLKQGIFYYLTVTDLDLLMMLVIAIALYFVVSKKLGKYYPLMIGMIFYMLYILKIGGDFMGGRFLVPVFFLAIIILSQIKLTKMVPFYTSIAIIVLIGLFNPKQPLLSDVFYGMKSNETLRGAGVADERAAYFQESGLLRVGRMNMNQLPANVAAEALEAKKRGQQVIIKGSIGMYGYYAGPDIYLLDYFALADPLLARLPVGKDIKENWRVGHFTRPIPCGYEATLATGQNRICDPDLAVFYDKLKIIDQAPIFSWQRFETIIAMNLGYYNKHVDSYIERNIDLLGHPDI